MDVRLHSRGRAAHSSTPHLGINAAEAMIEYLGRALRQPAPDEHPDLGARTVTLTRIVSGLGAVHTVPSGAEALLDVRLLPGGQPEIVFDLLPATARSGSAAIEVELGDSILPVAWRNRRHRSLRLPRPTLLSSAAPASTKWMSGSSDMGYLYRAGIPTACFGPGDERLAHTDDEHIDIDQAIDTARVYARLVVR